jgi:hypothetical protein
MIFARNNKNKNIRDLHEGINEFKKGCRPKNGVVKGEKCRLLAEYEYAKF